MKIPRIIRVLMRGICFRYAKKNPAAWSENLRRDCMVINNQTKLYILSNAWLRSAMMSSACSVPMERRIVLW